MAPAVAAQKRLNRPGLARLIFQHQVTMLEFGIERLLDNLVEPVVFALPRESALPGVTMLEFSS